MNVQAQLNYSHGFSVRFNSIGSSGWVGGAKKHEIYVATFGGHLFFDLFLQG